MITHVYCDQNCLIDLEHEHGASHRLVEAMDRNNVRIVLSPWHWVEVARNSNDANLIKLANFADSLDPVWLPERRTVQRLEVEARLEEFLGFPAVPPSMFRPFEWVAQDVLRQPLPKTKQYTIKDFALAIAARMEPIYEAHRLNHESRSRNLKDWEQGKLTVEQIKRVFRSTVEGLLPDRLPQGKPLGPATKHVFLSQLTREKYPAVAVELALFEDELDNGAQLGFSSLSDNNHTIVSLPYVDFFATSDQKLSKRIVRVRGKLTFRTAQPIGKQRLDQLIHGDGAGASADSSGIRSTT